jgi:MFS superfamily sulfate permease-like transporter
MTATAVSVVTAGQRTSLANAAAVLAMAVGAICLLGWIGRLGFLANLLSWPVLIGYMN